MQTIPSVVLIPVLLLSSHPCGAGISALSLAPIAQPKLPAHHFLHTPFHNHLVIPLQRVCAFNRLHLLAQVLRSSSGSPSEKLLPASRTASSQPAPLRCISKHLWGRNDFSDVKAESTPLAPKISFNNTAIFSISAHLPKTCFRAHCELPSLAMIPPERCFVSKIACWHDCFGVTHSRS